MGLVPEEHFDVKIRAVLKDTEIRSESMVFSSDIYVKMFLGYKPHLTA